MNIEAIGNPSRGARSVCCGAGFCPALPAGQAADKMRQRAASMPCQDAVVTCVTLQQQCDGGRRQNAPVIPWAFGMAPAAPGGCDFAERPDI